MAENQANGALNMKDYILPEANPIMAYLIVTDMLKTAEFYKKAFGFSEIERVDDGDGSPMHIGMGYEGKTAIMFSTMSPDDENLLPPKTSSITAPITICIYCKDVDALYKQALAAGAVGISEPEDMFWGDRMCRLRDIENYRWSFSTHTGKKTAP